VGEKLKEKLKPEL